MKDISHPPGIAFSVAAKKRTNTAKNEQRILRYLETVPNATCDEVEVALGMSHQTCSSRFTVLRRTDRIVPVGRRETRTGCMAQTFTLARGRTT
jgi:hypothetical protein